MGNIAQSGRNYAFEDYKRKKLIGIVDTENINKEEFSLSTAEASIIPKNSVISNNPINIDTGFEITDDTQLFPTMFKWEGGGKEVFFVTSYNNWQPIPMIKCHNDFFCIFDLPEGIHEFKFVVDGSWMHSPTEKTVQNPMNSLNNVVSVSRSDFEPYECLKHDLRESQKTSTCSQAQDYTEYYYDDDGFSQQIPLRYSFERKKPPSMPVHLMSSVLNESLPINVEPNLLREPSHAVLQHLFVLSINKGVLVLSSSHRYRKKFYTTLLYRPASKK